MLGQPCDPPSADRAAGAFQGMGRHPPIALAGGLAQSPNRLWQLRQKQLENLFFKALVTERIAP